MCGFAGEYLYTNGRADLDRVRQMARALTHRGPDDAGEFLSPDGRCAMAFQRLEVIDPAGSPQPMSLPDGTTVVYNGEIYNFRQLRRQLRSAGASFHTHGDTEVLLHLHRQDPDGLPGRLRGMFAFAIYDPHRGLLLARDPIGQKPLYYAPLPDRILFASEPKALLLHPALDTRADHTSISYYITIGYIPSPLTAWSGVRKLRPANVLRATDHLGRPQRYWWPRPEPISAEGDDLTELVRSRVTESIRSHLVADVPLGVLLSGGMDSAIVAAVAAEEAKRAGSGERLRTFTAAFDDPAYDESAPARAVADHLGTDHTELPIHADPAAMLDFVVNAYDEPFADSSAYPTHLISRAARELVTVALTGDGGDECFAGYDRYRALLLARTMGPARCAGVCLAAALLRPFARGDQRSRVDRFLRFARSVSLPSSQQYFALRRLFGPEDLARLLTNDFLDTIDAEAPQRWFTDLYEETDRDYDDEVLYAQRCDLLTYLPDDVLRKTDIASMACSLELRAPFVDPDLITLGLGLPLRARTDTRRGKRILEKAFGHLLPKAVFRRRKRGFGLPLGHWLRNELRDQLRETLLDDSFLSADWVRPEAVAGLLNDHISGRCDHSQRIWALMVLARWLAASK